MIKIWRLELKQSNTHKLSVIIPLVLFHGQGKWNVDDKFSSIIKESVKLLPEYIPDFKYILYDLSRYSDDQIKGTVMARVAMLLLKHIINPDFEKKLPDIFSLLKDLSEKETGLQYFESLIKYVLSNVENMTVEKIKAIVTETLSKEKGDIIMTLAELLRNEGLEQGLERGLIEGIEFAVSIKFGDTDDCKTVIAKIKSIKDLNHLKALKGKIKSAKSVPELIRFIET